MDGVISGLTSIVPIMPEQSTIMDRSGVKGPPVEIMPLPSNSFMSEDATAELLNNPFTLSLDIRGYKNSEGGKAAGRTAVQAGRTAMPEDEAAGALLNHAYTLSLGNDENVPVAAEIAREMSRMRNYELLGKNPTRQLYRMNPDTGAAEHVAAQAQNTATIDMISEKVSGLMSQPLAGQNAAFDEMTAQTGEINAAQPRLRDVALTSPELLPEGTANTPQADPASAGIRKDTSLLYNLAHFQLSASDIETLLTLEPELQEAMLNMLSTVNSGGSGKMADETAAGLHTPVKQGAPPENNAAVIGGNVQFNAQPEIIRQTLGDVTRPLNSADIELANNIQANAHTAPLTDEELVRLLADAVTGEKAFNTFAQSTLRGSMHNLQKVNELPYSLYLFGNVTPDSRGAFEEADIAVPDESGAAKKATAEFLKISDAIKMASVLHNIYYGGSGRFPRETPWYAPYVRYAIRHGIIRDDEFGDYNEPATRAEAAYIFSGCVPEAEFPIINFVSELPDVGEAVGYGARIYLLYRAGILTRSDKKDGFRPEDMITRSEAAAIIGRIATPADRKHF